MIWVPVRAVPGFLGAPVGKDSAWQRDFATRTRLSTPKPLLLYSLAWLTIMELFVSIWD